MIRFPLLILVICLGLKIQAQNSFADRVIRSSNEVFLKKYELDTSQVYILVASEFGEENLAKIDLSSTRVTKIDYVSTTHSLTEDFDQYQLDKKRINSLVKSNRFLRSYEYLTWEFFRQGGCKSSWDCKGFFHGFVIYYTPEPSEKSMKYEIASLLDFSEDIDSKISLSDSLIDTMTWVYECEKPIIHSQFRFLNAWKNKRKKKIKVKTLVHFEGMVGANGRLKYFEVPKEIGNQHEMFTRYFKRFVTWKPGFMGPWKVSTIVKGTISFPLTEESIQVESYENLYDYGRVDTVTCKGEKTIGYKSIKSYRRLKKGFNAKVVSTVLDRNISDWKDMALVIDVTGSMSPYNKGLLLWLKLTTLNDVKSATFFNDGDMKTEKQIGSTKGIYSIKSNDFKEITMTMVRAMSNGYGGDCPENNFEALLGAKKNCKECTDFVMVADNYAFPRDPMLLKSFQGNLKLVLCGTEYGINTEYLDLARKYKFSIHTLTSDIDDLMKIHNGESVVLDGINYQIINHRFVRKTEI